MEIGVDSFVAILPDPITGEPPTPAARMAALLEEVETAEHAGLDFFGIGEHHRKEFLDSAPAVILAAAAARTKRIRLTSAVTVLSTADPVRVFQDFATIDLISQGRAELTVGRGSFGEAYPLFGFGFDDYDALFAEKLDLLLSLREDPVLRWTGKYRPPLTGQGIFPRPHQAQLPIWLGVGGTPQSFVRAGTLGLPLMVAIIGGDFARFRPLVDLYRTAGMNTGHRPEALRVGLHAFGFVGEEDAAARDAFFPGWHHMFTEVGRERGWPPATREQFDALCSLGGAYLIGSPATVIEKARRASEALGGISRMSLQMSSASLAPASMNESIHLLGTAVAPSLRNFSSGGAARHG